jgi:hypothetical protein
LRADRAQAGPSPPVTWSSPTGSSLDLARRLPDSDLVIYPDAGHDGIFQFRRTDGSRGQSHRIRTATPRCSAKEHEGVLDALFEDLVGELRVGQGA